MKGNKFPIAFRQFTPPLSLLLVKHPLLYTTINVQGKEEALVRILPKMRFYKILAILICLPDDSRQTRYSDHGPPRTLPTPSSLRLQDCRITLSMFEPVFLGLQFPRSGARYNIDCHLDNSLKWSILLKSEYPERFDITATVTGVGGVPAPFGLNSDFRDCRMGLSRFGSWWSWSFPHPFLGHEK